MTDTTSGRPRDPASTASLTIDAPDSSPADDSIAVCITGVDPGVSVDFTARLTDDAHVTWRSTATFEAASDGSVDLTRDAPESGDWTGVEPMGWLWSMRPDADAMGVSLDGRPTMKIELTADTDSQTANHQITRRRFDPGLTQISVDAEGVVGTLFEPPGDTPAPGVIDLHGSGGRRSHRSARLLATHGFAVLSLDYVGEHDALPDHIANVDLAYFDRAADWVLDQPTVSGDRVGLFGVSRGAEAAILLGARRDWVGAVVSYAGSGVPWDTPHDEPAWLDDGDPVPHIVADDNHPNRTDLDTRPLRDCLPPVERTNGPILLLSGGSDPVWDARRLSQVVVDHLDDTDFDHDYAHLTYDDVGHLIGIPYVPLGGFCGDDQLAATARAGADSWPVVLDYLESGL